MRHPWKLPLAVVCVLALAFLPLLPARRGSAQSAAYDVTDVGTLGGAQSAGLGLDECGKVVGESLPTGSATNRPFLWDDGTITDLGTFGGSTGTASGVNNSGAVSGSAQSVASETRPFFLTPGSSVKTDLGTVPPPTKAGAAAAYDINESNQVVGQWEISPLQDRAFVWTQATGMQVVTATWGTPIAAYGINNAGQIVGTAEKTSTGEAHAFFRSGGVTTEIGTLGGTNSFAYEVNESGVVVGYANIPSAGASRPFHAIRWTASMGTPPQDLGTLGGTRSIAYGINASGQVVGYSEIAGGAQHAFLWSDDNSNGAADAGEMKDLNTLVPGTGWTFQEARAINDRGQIVGTGVSPSGAVHAFLLTPTNVGPSPCDPTPTPTPTPTPVPGVLQFSSAAYTVGENGVAATVTVTRTGGDDGAVSVNFATSNGTAVAGTEYTAASGTVNFADGETGKTFQVLVADDSRDETDKTVNLSLSAPGGGATLGAQATAVLTINDDDPTPTLSVSDATVTEGNAGTTDAKFTVTLSAASSKTVTVKFTTSDVSAESPEDFTAVVNAALTFAPGETEKFVNVPVVGDTIDEPNEGFGVSLSEETNATIPGLTERLGVGTITDDDGAPSLTIGDATVTEGNAGTTNAAFTVTLLPASGQTVTVNYATANGTANAASGDYAAAGGTLTFDPGQTSKTVNVAVNGDATPEAHETFFVNLSGETNAAFAAASDRQGQGTVNNDDTTLTIGDRSETEGNSGNKAFNFNVTLSHPSVNPVSVNYTTADGTATAGSDYAAASNVTLNIPAGNMSGTITVQVVGDNTFENAETFFVNLSSASGATIGDNQGLGTINNDEAFSDFQFKLFPNQFVGEAAGSIDVVVVRTGSTAGGVSINYATSNGTATAGADYTATSGTLNFGEGETEKKFTVVILNDEIDEPTETVNLSLSSPVGGTGLLNSGAFATLNINDSKLPTFQYSAPTYTVSEGVLGGTATITVTRTGSLNAASITYSTTNGTATAGADYTGTTNGTLNFAANETSKTFDVPIHEDALIEANETVFLTLSGGIDVAFSSQRSATLTIIDNEGRPSLSVADVTVDENAGKARFTVTLSAVSTQAVTFNYATANGTALAAALNVQGDYAAALSQQLTIDPGQPSTTFDVFLINDALDEADETFLVNLSGASNATIADAQGVGTINDDDATPTLSVNDANVNEGAAGPVNANFMVTLSAASGRTVTVNYATADGTATQPGDYASASGTLTFNPGDTSKPITVAVNGDTTDEPNETFFLNLSAPSNAAVNDGQGVGTITDDDGAPTISITDASMIGEGPSAVFIVTLSAPSGQTVTIDYSTANDTATAGSDYVATTDTLTFNPGETTRPVVVLVNNDALDEADETFFVNLSGAANATVSDEQGVGTIVDDDGAPSLTVGDVTVTEGNSGTVNAVFNVTLAPASGQAVSVNYATADGTATAGSDYAAAAGTLNFAAGETSKTVTVQVSGDASNEADENFFVNLSGASNATVADAQGSGAITNDDTPTLRFAQAAFPANESAHFVTVTVTRAGDATAAAAVDFATGDGTATERKDYTAVSGTLRFAAGETSKSFDVLLTEDAFNEPDETVNLTLSNPAGGAVLGAQAAAAVVIAADDNPPPAFNPIDVSSDFVRQHYHDFLNREPDASGLNHWTNEIESCGADASCREVKRINVSAAFFLSIEFQETGYLVYRAFKAAYGDATSPNVPGTVPAVRLHEFLPDTRRIGEGVVVGPAGWELQLEANKSAYLLEFVGRQRFAAAFPATRTPAQFVDALYANAGVTPTASERQAAVGEFGGAASSADAGGRARALRLVAEHPALVQAEFRRAFVLMQYYGYLRRNPDEAPEPGLNFGGWNFWLGKLNEFNGNFAQAEMVKAFLNSDEYRNRFGQ